MNDEQFKKLMISIAEAKFWLMLILGGILLMVFR